MTTIVDFPSLCASVADFLNRADLTQQIPSFVALAEAELNKLAKSRRMITNQVVVPVVAGNRTAAIPDNFIVCAYMQMTGVDSSPLEPIEMSALIMLRRNRLRLQGTPLYYAVNGSNFEFVPTPAVAGSVTMDYYALIPALSTGSPTNWLILKDPDVYLQTTLKFAQQFLKDNDAVQVLNTLATAAIGSQVDRDDMAQAGSGSFSLNSPSDPKSAPAADPTA